MLAAVLTAPRRVLCREVPDPEPGPGQVRIRMQGAGICASELPAWAGRQWFEYPLPAGAPGHEGWGVVDAVGEAVNGPQPGTRVAAITTNAHAELDVAQAAHVVALPDGLAAGTPFPGEPLACAINAMRRAGIAPGDRVAVVGAGFQALLLVELCAPVAARVDVVARRPQARRRAIDAGATAAWSPDDEALWREPGFDVVIEATGHQAPLDLAARLTRVRGRLVIVGYHQDGPRTVDMQLWNWRGLDVINAHERDPLIYADGLREAVGAVEDGRISLEPLLTHIFTLQHLGDAYATACERPDDFVKAVWLHD